MKMTENIEKEFPELTFLKDEPLSRYTNTKTGGKADLLIFPTSSEIVQQLLSYADKQIFPLQSLEMLVT